jgi:hypothetical protein
VIQYGGLLEGNGLEARLSGIERFLEATQSHGLKLRPIQVRMKFPRIKINVRAEVDGSIKDHRGQRLVAGG